MTTAPANPDLVLLTKPRKPKSKKGSKKTSKKTAKRTPRGRSLFNLYEDGIFAAFFRPRVEKILRDYGFVSYERFAKEWNSEFPGDGVVSVKTCKDMIKKSGFNLTQRMVLEGAPLNPTPTPTLMLPSKPQLPPVNFAEGTVQPSTALPGDAFAEEVSLTQEFDAKPTQHARLDPKEDGIPDRLRPASTIDELREQLVGNMQS